MAKVTNMPQLQPVAWAGPGRAIMIADAAHFREAEFRRGSSHILTNFPPWGTPPRG